MTIVATSAANPCADSMSVMSRPRVLMIRQPPEYVPAAMATATFGRNAPVAMRVAIATGRVMKAAGEVEEQSQQDDERDQERDVHWRKV